jgi:probable rRNA maturation factor
MIELVNETDFEFDTKYIQEITKLKTNKDVEFVLTDNENIKLLNLNFRQKDEPTDVLSFPYESMPGAPLGTVIVSLDFAMMKAKELGHSIDHEITLLFLHGLLHILGYDHEIDNGEQRSEEERILNLFNLPKSLIVRNG